VPISTLLVAALVAAVVSVVVSVLTTLAFSTARDAWSRRGTVMQEGQIVFNGVGIQEVYYPLAYVSPPNLQVTQNDSRGAVQFKVTEQKPDHFKIEQISSTGYTVHFKWRAEGVRLK
jgi:hypothetical protein